MINNNSKVKIGTMEVSEAEYLKSQLLKKNIQVELKFNPTTCRGGCRTKTEIWAQNPDIPLIASFLQGRRESLLSDLNVDWQQALTVINTNEEVAKCPACGFVFPSNSQQCPDCGLSFGHIG